MLFLHVAKLPPPQANISQPKSQAQSVENLGFILGFRFHILMNLIFLFCCFRLLKNNCASEVEVERGVRMSGRLGLGDLDLELVKLGLLINY